MPRNSNPTDSGNGNDATILLNMLSAVDEDSGVTQRTLAGNLGIALGLANAYLKRAVKKGLIKVTQAPANRYAYYLTPKGFTEKSQLTAEYFSQSSSSFVRRADNAAISMNIALPAGGGVLPLPGLAIWRRSP